MPKNKNETNEDVAKIPKKDVESICGIELSEIREAYFDGKLKKMLNKMMSKGDVGLENAENLGNFLKTLEKTEKTVIDKIEDVFGDHIIETKEEKLPSVEELQGEVQDMSEEWRKKQEKADAWLDSIYATISKIQGGATPPANFWGDTSMNIIITQSVLDKIRVYFDQQYRARIIAIMDKTDCTRKAAEDRAKLTPQYRDYKNALLLRERLEDLIINTRKREQYNNHM